MTSVIIGLVSSILTSLVKVLNRWMARTPFKGKGATILSLFMALAGAIGFQWYNGTLVLWPMRDLLMTFSIVFATAELYYKFVVEMFFPFLAKKVDQVLTGTSFGAIEE